MSARAKRKPVVSPDQRCKVATCEGFRDRHHDVAPCPAKDQPYAPPPRRAHPSKTVVHQHVAMLVAEARLALNRVERATAYEGTDYGEMLGDLRETARDVGRLFRDAEAYVCERYPAGRA